MSAKNLDANDWVVLAPQSALNNETATIVPLRHPRTQKSALYLFAEENSSVFEVMSYTPDFGSWFINDTVKQDGKLQMITPVDPLFLALPYLIAAKKENRTLPLDDLFIDQDFPESCRINNCKGLAHLKRIADRKGGDTINAWAFNEEKTLDWLKTKTENLVEALNNQNMPGMNGAVSKTFVMSSKLKDTEDSIGCLNNACGFISEYLPEELSRKLREHLKLPDVETLKRKYSSEALSAKRSRLDMAGQGVPSSSDNSKSLPKKTPAKGPTAKEKSQMRAAAGSRSITSFFKKK